jgi:hypothetical protein
VTGVRLSDSKGRAHRVPNRVGIRAQVVKRGLDPSQPRLAGMFRPWLATHCHLAPEIGERAGEQFGRPLLLHSLVGFKVSWKFLEPLQAPPQSPPHGFQTYLEYQIAYMLLGSLYDTNSPFGGSGELTWIAVFRPMLIESCLRQEIRERRKRCIKMTTGCKAFDAILGGGVETGSITEVYGE